MSLILEALRKSEAERRRGQVPGLHAERAPAALPSRVARPTWPWLALAIAVLLAAAWLARSAWAPSPAAGGAPGTSVARLPAEPARNAGNSPNDDLATAAAISATNDGRSDIGPSGGAADPPGSAASTLSLPATRIPPVILMPPGAAAIADTDARAPLSPARAANAAPPAGNRSDASTAAITPAGPATAVATPRPTPLPVPATSTVAAAPASAPAPASASPSAAVTPTPASPAIATPVRLSDLSTAERLELPPLKISMHMWDAAPTRRFAIIDGARVNEGDRLGDAVVEEITANAVVLAWRGQRLRIPLR